METLTINTDALNMTDDQFFLFCVQNRDLRIERDSKKQIYIMTPAGGLSGNRNIKVTTRLEVWNEKSDSGYTFDSSTGFTLPSSAMRSPDAAWIKKDRWEALPLEDQKRFAHICPDFIIELLSESDRLKVAKSKMEEWIENGCLLGWLIDFENTKVYVYQPNQDVKVIETFNSPVSGEDVLPGFELDLKEVM